MVGFWFFMLACDLLVPGIMIGFGKYFSKQAPKEINYIFGYRTGMSMKNRDTWEFAHQYIGKLWFRLGWIVLVPSAALLLVVFGKDIRTVGNVGMTICFLQLIPMIVPVFFTENALKKTFDQYGRRKNR